MKRYLLNGQKKITKINKKDDVENSCAEILLKLIKKLQKENEELKRFTSDIFNENEYVYYKHKDGTISTCPEIEIK